MKVDRNAGSVVVWSPPSVTIRGTVKSLELVFLAETTSQQVLVDNPLLKSCHSLYALHQAVLRQQCCPVLMLVQKVSSEQR